MLDRDQHTRSRYHNEALRSVAWDQKVSRYGDKEAFDERIVYRRKQRAMAEARAKGRFYNIRGHYTRLFFTYKGKNSEIDTSVASGSLYRDRDSDSRMTMQLRRRLQERAKRNFIVGQLRRAGYDVSDMRLTRRSESFKGFDGKTRFNTFYIWVSQTYRGIGLTLFVDETLLRRGEKCRLFREAFHNGMKKYVVQLSCGCCDAEMYFRSEESMAAAFEAAGLTVSGVITDDLGNTIDGVDTFYGVRRSDEDRRGLGYLIDQLANDEDDE